MTHAEQVYTPASASLSIGAALFAWLAKTSPAWAALAAIISCVAGLAATGWYGMSMYYKLKNKGKTP